MPFHFSSNLYIPKKEVAIYIFVIEKKTKPPLYTTYSAPNGTQVLLAMQIKGQIFPPKEMVLTT